MLFHMRLATAEFLTDAQELAVIHATRPLQARERAAFLAALEALLAGRNEIRDGELGRALRELQREHFRPPTDAETGMLETGA
jgi:Flp pilus assembly protein TadD